MGRKKNVAPVTKPAHTCTNIPKNLGLKLFENPVLYVCVVKPVNLFFIDLERWNGDTIQKHNIVQINTKVCLGNNEYCLRLYVVLLMNLSHRFSLCPLYSVFIGHERFVKIVGSCKCL